MRQNFPVRCFTNSPVARSHGRARALMVPRNTVCETMLWSSGSKLVEVDANRFAFRVEIARCVCSLAAESGHLGSAKRHVQMPHKPTIQPDGPDLRIENHGSREELFLDEVRLFILVFRYRRFK